ncbi:MAG: hypothetical protein V3V03_01905 [Hyphomonadaceae bacterium]
MTRKITGLLVAIYAITFAFAALAAVRWPSLMIIVGLLTEDAPLAGVAEIDWRQIGIAYGGPYLLAAVCLYMSAAMVSARRHGGVIWFIMGCAAGFPCVFLVDFEPGWWQNPSILELGVCVAGLLSLLLGAAVWDLRLRRNRPAPVGEPVSAEAEITAPVATITKVKPKPRRVRPAGPVPAAIARQRASFAMHGRKAMQKRGW